MNDVSMDASIKQLRIHTFYRERYFPNTQKEDSRISYALLHIGHNIKHQLLSSPHMI
jgi:hypothetical protein